MLSMLFVAFAGALGLKAWDERQAADNALLGEQLREAESLANHIRAELTAARAQLATLLQSGASLDAIRRVAGFDQVAGGAPASQAWAELTASNLVQIYQQDPQGGWVVANRALEKLLPPEATREGMFITRTALSGPTTDFQTVGFDRIATACAPIPDADSAVCMSKREPVLGADDAISVAIYLLLIAAPALAVIGLLQALASQAEANRTASANVRSPGLRTPAQPVPDLEVPGLIGVWRWDPASQILSLGKEAAGLFQLAGPLDITLAEFLMHIAEDDRARVQLALSGVDATAQIAASFQSIGRTSGRYFELFGGAIRGRYTGVLLNATDRIAAQHRSRRAEAIARAAIEAHPGPFAIWDARKRLTHWNTAFSEAFGLEARILHVGASHDEVVAEINKSVRSERPLEDAAGARELLLHSERWFRIQDRRTPGEGMITVATDITTIKQQEMTATRSEKRLRMAVQDLQRKEGEAHELATRLGEEKARAEHASQAKSVFLASMSHELHTPLNIIIGFSEIMSQEKFGPLGNPKYQEYSEDILDQGKNLLELIDDLLDMAKVEAGKLRLHRTRLDVTEPVDAAIRLVRRRAMDKELSLVFDPDDNLPEIDADHRAVKQMALNLLYNAIKFTDNGGQVRATVTREGDWIVIRVADTGIGIAEDDLPRLGERFVQGTAPDGRQRRGTGLGLALTKSFAEMHGGYLDIRSKVRVGTTVSVFLPIRAAVEAARPIPALSHA